jgi:hypothetical protein
MQARQVICTASVVLLFAGCGSHGRKTENLLMKGLSPRAAAAAVHSSWSANVRMFGGVGRSSTPRSPFTSTDSARLRRVARELGFAIEVFRYCARTRSAELVLRTESDPGVASDRASEVVAAIDGREPGAFRLMSIYVEIVDLHLVPFLAAERSPWNSTGAIETQQWIRSDQITPIWGAAIEGGPPP